MTLGQFLFICTLVCGAIGTWVLESYDAGAQSPIAEFRPNRGDAQRCLIDSWLRAYDPHSVWLPENGASRPSDEPPCSTWEKKR